MIAPNWLESGWHRAWLADHSNELLGFARRSPESGVGARWLDDRGHPLTDEPVHTWITARMVHVQALGVLLGTPGSGPLAEAAMSGLLGPLHDDADGGWYPSSDAEGRAAGKSCYDHTFVVLAAASAVHAGIDGADALFREATATLLERFWDEDAGMCVDQWDRSFSHVDDYRGLNANMHAVEAMLAAEAIVGDGRWLARAHRIAAFVTRLAADHDHRLPEHFDAAWTPLTDYNQERPADPFKPYGATVGHGFEWARLLVHLACGPDGPAREGLTAAAVELYDRAAGDGWHADGRPGFVYTTDWDGRPIVRHRFHWVAAEAIAAAAVLYRLTGEVRYATHYRQWWDHAATHLIDAESGSWHHELDDHNRPSDTVWRGKPDVYHAFQATLIPRAPLYPMLGAAMAAGRLG